MKEGSALFKSESLLFEEKTGHKNLYHTFWLNKREQIALFKKGTRANCSCCSFKKSDSLFFVKKLAIRKKRQRANSQPCSQPDLKIHARCDIRDSPPLSHLGLQCQKGLVL